MNRFTLFKSTVNALLLSSTLGLLSSNAFASGIDVAIQFKKGEMFCLASSDIHPGNEAKQGEYFQKVGPLIQSENIAYVGSLYTEEVIAGDHKVPGFGIIKMPGRHTKTSVNETRLSEWQHVRATRPDVWRELRLQDFDVKANKTFVFNTDKYYQLEAYWVHNDKLPEFHKYQHNRLKNAEQQGGRLFHSFEEPYQYESLGMERAPDRFYFIEWDSKEAFQKFQNTKQQPFKYLAGYNAWLTKVDTPRT